ncbi:MAG: hypothetical protein AB8B48_00275 [Pseudomonadales bacterium]
MPSSFLEIVELPNGEIVLLRADGEGEPLVNIRFSEESKTHMPEARLEIARAMIQAGIETAVMLSEENEDGPGDLRGAFIEEDEDTSEPRVLH